MPPRLAIPGTGNVTPSNHDAAAEFRRRIRGLRDRAAAHYHGNAREALAVAEEALRQARTQRDDVALGWGHRALAEALLFAGRIRESNESYRRAAGCFHRGGDESTLGQLLVGHVHVLALLGRNAIATATAARARRLLMKAGDTAYLAKLSMNLGNFYFQREKSAEALNEYNEAAALFRKLRIRDEAVFGVEINRGVAMTQLDRHGEAIELFDSLESEAAENGYEILNAQIRMNRAYVHSLRAQYDRALADTALAADYFRETDHPAFLGSSLLSRADIYNQLNLGTEVEEIALEAIGLFKRTGLRFDCGLAYTELAVAKLGRGMLGDARRSIRRARAIYQREGNGVRTSLMDLLEGEVLFQRKDTDRAERLALAAYEKFRRMGLIQWQASAAILLSRISPDRFSRRVRLISRKFPEALYPHHAYRILHALGDVHTAGGRDREAGAAYRRAVKRLRDMRWRIPTEESKLAFLKDKSSVFDRLVSLEVGARRPSVDRLFGWIEESKAQVFEDVFRSPGGFLDRSNGRDDGMRPDAVLEEKRRDLSWLHGRLSRMELDAPDKRERIERLRSRVVRAERDWSRTVTESLEKSVSRSGHQRREDDFPRLDAVRGCLREGWGFLSFFLGDVESVVVAVTREDVRRAVVPGGLFQRVQAAADHLDFLWSAACLASIRTSTGNGEGGGMKRLGRSAADVLRDLYKALWAPVEDLGVRPKNGWVVSPHGPMHRIPLHALLGSNGYLIETVDLVLAPSAGVWLSLSRRPSRSRRSAWIAGVPSPQLPAVEQEVRLVAEELKAWHVDQDLAPDRDGFLTRGHGYGLVHVAAHGSLRPENPAFSYLQLSDGPFFAHDLRQCRFHDATIVLTACSSGAGIAPTGNEWIGLSRGFLMAGASSVVGSLWPVHDLATLELMRRFYPGISRGRSPAESLGDAMRGLLKDGFETWQWAPFAVFGRG